MGGGARSRALIVTVVLVVAAAVVLLLRAGSASLTPEVEQVQKALLAKGYIADDPAALLTEPGASARLDVRANQSRGPGPRRSCLVTVGVSLAEVVVGERVP